MRKLHILVDMDETVAYLHKFCLKKWNQDYPHKPMTFADLPTWDSGAVFMEYFERGETYRHLEVVPHSQDVLRHWVKQGHHVQFITASPPIAECQEAKRVWVDEHFPFIGRHNVIFSSEKGKHGGDVLIDDSPKYLSQFEHGVAVKHNRQYNKHVPADHAFSQWHEIKHMPFLSHPKMQAKLQTRPNHRGKGLGY